MSKTEHVYEILFEREDGERYGYLTQGTLEKAKESWKWFVEKYHKGKGAKIYKINLIA